MHRLVLGVLAGSLLLVQSSVLALRLRFLRLRFLRLRFLRLRSGQKRTVSIVLIACILVELGGEIVFAAPFIPKMNKPESYKDFLFGMEETRQNAASVQCGGWADTGASVKGSSVVGDIPLPKITASREDGGIDDVALPGRKNTDALSNPSTGVGERGNYEYPDTAFGFMTACDFRSPGYMDDDIGWVIINPDNLCQKYDKATPDQCKKLYDHLRSLARDSSKHPMIGNADCPTQKKSCFDYTEECKGQGCRTPNFPSFSQELTECHLEQDDAGNPIVVIDKESSVQAKKSSFYRHYAGKFKEPGIVVEAPTTPLTLWKVRAECYEYYQEHPDYLEADQWKEHDPKEVVTGPGDEQCEIVISTPDEANPDTPEWPDGGGREQREPKDWSAPQERGREDRPVPDPWVSDAETNLSLIDMERVKELQEKFSDPDDVTSLVATLLPTRQRASDSTPENARTDTFDDTGDRVIGTFWEAQQRELLKMISDPTTRLIMPARFLMGLDDDDPLYQYVRHIVSKSEGTVEITLRAGLEDIGNVLQSLERMFVGPIQEVRIPLIVPLASTAEIDSLLFQWTEWQEYDRRRSEAHAKNARENGNTQGAEKIEQEREARKTKAEAVIQRLRQYLGQADKARRLRGALPKYLQKLFASQAEIREYFVRWQRENRDLLEQARAASIQRKELQRIWKFTQRAMLMTDACQMLWCSNARYTLPLYSLTDGWWEKGDPGSARNLKFTPRDLRDLNYRQPKDAVFDFSHVKFPRDPFLIPVLWPVHAKVRLPIPPAIGVDPPEATEFFDLPSIPDESVFDTFSVPETDLPPFSVVVVPEPVNLSEAKDILREFRQIIDGAPPEEQMMQEEAEADGSLFHDLDGEFYGRGAMRDAYCQFPKSVLIPPDDEAGNPRKIIHPEIDLRDRALRLFARWMPEQTEDRAGRVARLKKQFGSTKPPCREDILCYFLPVEQTTTTIWQWFMPTSSADFTALGKKLKDATLPDEGENPYLDTTTKILERIFGGLPLPIRIDLTPPLPVP